MKQQAEGLLGRLAAKDELSGDPAGNRIPAAAATPGAEVAAVRPSPVRQVVPPLILGLPATHTGRGEFTERMGFFFRFGGGVASVDGLTVQSPSGTTSATGAVWAAMGGGIGGSVAPGLALSFDMAMRIDLTGTTIPSSASESQSHSGRSMVGIGGPGLTWFPSPNHGLALGLMAGAALVAWKPDSSSGSSSQNQASGFGGELRVGYYFRVSPKWQLGGAVEALTAQVDRNSDGYGQSGSMSVTSIALLLGGVAL